MRSCMWCSGRSEKWAELWVYFEVNISFALPFVHNLAPTCCSGCLNHDGRYQLSQKITKIILLKRIWRQVRRCNFENIQTNKKVWYCWRKREEESWSQGERVLVFVQVMFSCCSANHFFKDEAKTKIKKICIYSCFFYCLCCDSFQTKCNTLFEFPWFCSDHLFSEQWTMLYGD